MLHRSQRAWVALLGIVLYGLLLFVVLGSVRGVGRSFPGFLVWDNGTLVAFHTTAWTGAQAGLPLNGGRIVAVDGAPFAGGRALLESAARLAPGSPLHYRVLAQGETSEVSVPVMRLSAADYGITFGNYVWNAAFLFAIGLVALALRPDAVAARALAAATIVMGLLLALTIDFISTYRFIVLCQLIEAGAPAALAFFALVFPVERVPAARRGRLVAGLAGAALLIGGSNAVLFRSQPDLARRITDVIYVLLASVGLGSLVSFAVAVFRAESARERVQAAVVFAGSIASFLFPAIAILAFFLLGWTFSFTWVTAVIFLFPVSILYAIVRHDLLAAERFIRLTVGYAVASSTVVLAYAVVTFAIDRLISPDVPRSPAAGFAWLLAIGVSFDPLRRRVQSAVDRIFYRSVVDPGKLLEESGSELVALSDESAIVAQVASRLREALALEWAELAVAAEAPEHAALSAAVTFRDEKLGTIACGPKRSGAPFSSDERDLVSGLASQAALALRNARSIGALREAQAELLRRERLAAIGELAGAVAHGLRNPLAGIRAAAQMAREEAREPEMASALDGLIGESDRLEQRVSGLLDFSRPFDPRPRACDLAELVAAVERAMTRQAERAGVAVQIDLVDASLVLETDPDYLEEVLLELAGNALRAMPRGGTLRLEARREASRLALRVSDTGGGIPEAVRHRIFELFFTTRPEGTGLGLATVKKIVERLGGSVVLERSGPDGSTFCVTLPANA